MITKFTFVLFISSQLLFLNSVQADDSESNQQISEATKKAQKIRLLNGVIIEERFVPPQATTTVSTTSPENEISNENGVPVAEGEKGYVTTTSFFENYPVDGSVSSDNHEFTPQYLKGLFNDETVASRNTKEEERKKRRGKKPARK